MSEPRTSEPRLTTVLGVARAVLATVGPRVATPALVDEFGWDRTFQALALLRGDLACEAFGLAWEKLLTDEVEAQLAQPAERPGPSDRVQR